MISPKLLSHFFITSDKQKIFYQTNFSKNHLKETSRPLLVFNYGLLCNFAHWKYQLDFFHHLQYPILQHHYRGHFTSGHQADFTDCTFQQFAQDLHEILQELGVKKCIMIGHSMGVNISLHYYFKNFKIVNKLILISGTLRPPQNIMFNSHIMEIIFSCFKYLHLEYPETFNKFWKLSGLNPITQKIVQHFGFNKKTVDLNYVQEYLNRISQLPSDLFFQLFEEMGQHQHHNQKMIKSPTLIISGDKDRVVPFHTQKDFSEIISSIQYFILRGGGHVPQVDFPELVNRRMHHFIQKD